MALAGQVRSGQVRSGQVRSGAILLIWMAAGVSCEEHKVPVSLPKPFVQCRGEANHLLLGKALDFQYNPLYY